MEMYDETPKIWTGYRSKFAQAISVLNKIMMHTRATKFDRANLLAML